MQDSKLHLVLSTMNVFELKRLSRFMASPYHNEDARLSKLYDHLLPYYKTDPVQIPDRYKIWKKVYGTAPFTNLRFARLLSDLLKKVEAFISIERMRQQGADESYYLLDTYNARGLVKHFTEPYMNALDKLDKQPYRDRDYYFHTFRLRAEQNIFLENRKERNTEKYLLETAESLDTYYIINKLRYSAAILHYKQFLNIDVESILPPEMLAFIKRKPLIPVADVYYHVVLTLVEPEAEQHFIRLKELLLAHGSLLQFDTQKEIFAFALNYCIRKINQGMPAYQGELFSLYKDALERGLLLQDGVMTPWDYKNIVTVALRNKEYKWTDSFIESYISKLAKREQKNAYTFNRARYYFAVNMYDKVLKLLQDVEYSDVFYLLDAKITLMKTYYELGEYEPMLSLKESFRILLRRKKLISEQNQVNYGNFARITMKLYRADVKDKVQMASLKKAVESTSNIADKAWILEKYSEMVA